MVRSSDPCPVEQICVGGDLQKRLDLRVPGQLGVPHLVQAVLASNQEVGEPSECSVEECALVDDVRPVLQGFDRAGVCLGQRLARVRVRSRELDDVAPRRLEMSRGGAPRGLRPGRPSEPASGRLVASGAAIRSEANIGIAEPAEHARARSREVARAEHE